MTTETAEFLLWLINQQQLSASADDLEQVAQRIAAAKRELAEILSSN